MFQVTAATPAPIAAIMREAEGLRLKDREVVIAHYEAELEATELKRNEAKLAVANETQAIRSQEVEYSLNENLIEAALDACATGNLGPIRAAKRRAGQTWELFSESYPLQIAIKSRQKEVLRFLLESGVDYHSKNPHHLPAYEEVLTLALRRAITPTENDLIVLMFNQILKDFPKFSERGELLWFFDALNYAVKLIFTPIPGTRGVTPLMQLARDNHLAAIIKIDNEFGIPYHMQDELEKTIFDHAFECGHKELSFWLLHKTKSTVAMQQKAADPLIMALMEQDDLRFTELLGTQVDVTCRDNAALIAACRYGNVEQVKALNLAGVDLTARNQLALWVAIKRCHKPIVQYLLMQDSVYEAILPDLEKIERQLNAIGFKYNIQKIRIGWGDETVLEDKEFLMADFKEKNLVLDRHMMLLDTMLEETFNQLACKDTVTIYPGFPRFARSADGGLTPHIPISYHQESILSLLGQDVHEALKQNQARLDIEYTLKNNDSSYPHLNGYLTIKCHYSNRNITTYKKLAVLYFYQSSCLLINFNRVLKQFKDIKDKSNDAVDTIQKLARLENMLYQLEILIKIGLFSEVVPVGENKKINSLNWMLLDYLELSDEVRLTLECHGAKLGLPSQAPLLFSQNKSATLEKKVKPISQECSHGVRSDMTNRESKAHV